MRRLIFVFWACVLAALPAAAETVRWVDFDPKADAMQYAVQVDIDTSEKELHLSWLDILALAASRTGGSCTMDSVKRAAKELESGKSLEEAAGDLRKYALYYREAYGAALEGLVGSYAIYYDNEWHPTYGLKAFSPIAAGYDYAHYDDFGAGRNFGFARKHLGNDLLGSLGTPIVAVEGGVVEALGWNRYGGWRVGVRSFDGHRYYYYAHLKKDAPYAPGLAEGDMVEAGDLIGFMGRTGYSDKENTNNIETVHLHFGLQLIFDESQKECNSEIWIDVYELVKLLSTHRSSLKYENGKWSRVYPYRDLDTVNEGNMLKQDKVLFNSVSHQSSVVSHQRRKYQQLPFYR